MSLEKILEFDRAISGRMCIAHKKGLLRNLAIFFAHSGDSWFWLIGLGFIWFLGNHYWKQRVAVLIPAIICTAILIMLLKLTFRRRRPEGQWGSIYRNTDPHSFPSGHAARVFLIAVIMSSFGPIFLALFLWIWALLVCLARVGMGVHYLSDVVGGSIIGFLSGLGYLLVIYYL